MIENEIVVNKLKEEGIDENLAVGISFESEEALNTWVGTAKTFTAKPKDIKDYTADELKSLADSGSAKNLQSLLDKIRANKVEPKPVEVSPDLKAFQDKLDLIANELKANKEESLKAKFDSYVDAKTKNLDPLEVTMLKSTLPITATSADVDKAVSDYRALMVKRGLKAYSSESASSKSAGLDANFSSAVKDFVTSKTTKK